MMETQFNVCDFGAVGDGAVLCTAAIQAALDAAGTCGGQVTVPQGTYLTGALFVRSGTTLRLAPGAVLLGSTREEDYPLLPGRAAGIEMDWPAALVNIRDASHVRLCGEGTIDGQGEVWWRKYWDMRPGYEARGLRWAVDYDCTRPEALQVFRCEDVEIAGITLRRSGFWTVHLCYSRNVAVRGVTVRDNLGPSTDGIDVDSCRDVLIEGCSISCNDDNICLKAGRDADGLRVARPCENVTIRGNRLCEGEGITLGSETSGGIHHVRIENNIFRGTHNGFRVKSARTRGGVVEDILVDGMDLRDVRTAVRFELAWYSAYSLCAIPSGYEGEIPAHWRVMTQTVPPEQGLPHARDILLKHIRAAGCGEAFVLRGLPEAPFEGLVLEEVSIRAERLGEISHVKDPAFRRVELICGGEPT